MGSRACSLKLECAYFAERLEILSLSRNLIKKIEGLDFVANTLRQLWLSYNSIDKLVRCATSTG